MEYAALSGNKGMNSMMRTGDVAATSNQDVSALAGAKRKSMYGSAAQSKAPKTQKLEASNETVRSGGPSETLSGGLGNVVEEDTSGLFFKKKKG